MLGFILCLPVSYNTVYAATYVREDYHSITGYSSYTENGWEQDSVGWKWHSYFDTYLRSGWHLLDGNDDGFAEYYFIGDSGYLLMNTTTPDGYQVNADGARIVNGIL